MAQDKPYHEKPLIRDCCNHKGSCTLFRPYLTIAARISSSSFVRVSTRQLAASSLSKGISSTLNFHESIGTGWTPSPNLSHPKRAPYRLSYKLDCYRYRPEMPYLHATFLGTGHSLGYFGFARYQNCDLSNACVNYCYYFLAFIP